MVGDRRPWTGSVAPGRLSPICARPAPGAEEGRCLPSGIESTRPHTDGLRSNGVAKRDTPPEVRHRTGRHLETTARRTRTGPRADENARCSASNRPPRRGNSCRRTASSTASPPAPPLGDRRPLTAGSRRSPPGLAAGDPRPSCRVKFEQRSEARLEFGQLGSALSRTAAGQCRRARTQRNRAAVLDPVPPTRKAERRRRSRRRRPDRSGGCGAVAAGVRSRAPTAQKRVSPPRAAARRLRSAVPLTSQRMAAVLAKREGLPLSAEGARSGTSVDALDVPTRRVERTLRRSICFGWT